MVTAEMIPYGSWLFVSSLFVSVTVYDYVWGAFLSANWLNRHRNAFIQKCSVSRGGISSPVSVTQNLSRNLCEKDSTAVEPRDSPTSPWTQPGRCSSSGLYCIPKPVSQPHVRSHQGRPCWTNVLFFNFNLGRMLLPLKMAASRKSCFVLILPWILFLRSRMSKKLHTRYVTQRTIHTLHIWWCYWLPIKLKALRCNSSIWVI